MPRIEQVRRIIFNDEEIGMGFNSEAGLAVGTALEGFTIEADPTASGLEVIASITIISSQEELMSRLNMSFEAQGRYGFFSGSAKAEFAESSNYNSTSTFLVARCIVQNPLKRGKNFSVRPAAQDLLDAGRFDEFTTAFGDSFVRGLQTGGEFYSVIRITSVSTSTQTDLAAELQAEANGLVASGSFKSQMAAANASASTSSEMTATMFQKAGSGAQITPTVEISEVIARFKQFPQIAQENPVAFESEVATYDTLPLPVPAPEEQEAFLFALRDAREKKLRYIQTRNDLEFALRNPPFFERLPSSDVLQSAISVYARLIDDVTEHAIRLSRGQITPPTVFDPGAVLPPIVEPEPIALQRVAPPTIRVPNLVGITGDDLDFARRCLSAGSVDECLAGTVFPDQDENPVPIRVGRDVAEFIALVQSGQLTFTTEPDRIDSSVGRFESRAQFPSPETLVSSGSEVILQFGELPTGPPPALEDQQA